tara:strand:+ start:380 stop:553 length:174 start_codon:yes stop_codon:yes gene_type:complete
MIYSHANFHIHRATHDNEWVEWETEEELDYNEIEKSLVDIVDSEYDPENYFKPEGTE